MKRMSFCATHLRNARTQSRDIFTEKRLPSAMEMHSCNPSKGNDVFAQPQTVRDLCETSIATYHSSS
ncbi:hypothetical protein PC129_g13765 [Phytophthora cactorum]|uniref:Uncharacterized protein n=1 Tax=Phytophthora cactorum TaxID=29920 RepID=A0A8T1HS81_9STRA|nr:hypothetical protein PC129_g13765 [Phytophthora cactorum]